MISDVESTIHLSFLDRLTGLIISYYHKISRGVAYAFFYQEPLEVWSYPGDLDDLLQEADLWKRLKITGERHYSDVGENIKLVMFEIGHDNPQYCHQHKLYLRHTNPIGSHCRRLGFTLATSRLFWWKIHII